MTTKRISYDELVDLMKQFRPGEEITMHIIPFGIVPCDDEIAEYYPILIQKTNQLIVAMGGNCKSSLNPASFIAKEMLETTYGVINFSQDDIIENTQFCTELQENFDRQMSIVPNKPIFAFVYINVYGRDELDDVISKYIAEFQKRIKNDPHGDSYTNTLVYMSEANMAALARGTTYTIVSDHGEKITVQVSDGIMHEQNLSDLYRCKEGNVRVEEMAGVIPANFPSYIDFYKAMIPNLADGISNIWYNTDLYMFADVPSDDDLETDSV